MTQQKRVLNDEHFNTKPIWKMIKHIVIAMLVLYATFALIAAILSYIVGLKA